MAGIDGRRALVTGGGRGIGRAIALRLAEAGADVAVAARTPSEIEDVAARIEAYGRRALAIRTDVTDPTQVEAMARRLEAWGGVDILVNNAAWIRTGAFLESPREEWERVVEVGLLGVERVTRAVLPQMLEAPRGDIVMISSTSGKRGDPGHSAYNAAKFGLMGLAHALLYEVRTRNIRVTVVSPSRVDTREVPPEKIRREGKGALLRMEDVAEAVLFCVALPHRALVREIELWGTNP
jgi:3-oxoacyl-[acyl-carrier protein] reductase